ncbi:hypothetical protein [Herminiimonas fonticola]|uniref:hypothetical protein n=1 Tax=Herminiimonas fonticola TaxID=303380 RepID=UPI00334181A1
MVDDHRRALLFTAGLKEADIQQNFHAYFFDACDSLAERKAIRPSFPMAGKISARHA